MIIHLFNSSSVSGPEKLVLPALAHYRDQFSVVNLREERIDKLRESDPLKQFARSLKLPYRALTVRGRWDRKAMDELRELLKSLNPLLVHAHALKASVYLVQATQERDPWPIVSTHHGVQGLPDFKVRIYEWLYRKYFLRAYDKVLGVSSLDYQLLLRSGIRSDRLRLHTNGIDALHVPIERRRTEMLRIRAAWLPRVKDRDSLFLFGVVARLSEEKDHARLLRILNHLNRLRSERPWKCLMFGSGDLKDKLEQQVRDLDLVQRIVWMGYRNGVGNELVGLDLLLSCSKAEGLPINLVEAGWAATPVMSTRVGGVTDLIPDESYGNWILPEESEFESANRMRTFLTTEGQTVLDAQARSFQERVMREFTSQRWLDRLQDIYAELHVDFMDRKKTGPS